ncbi:MAG: hypothetical protein ACLQDI_05040 [Syntrophobacteraceae bacterium]
MISITPLNPGIGEKRRRYANNAAVEGGATGVSDGNHIALFSACRPVCRLLRKDSLSREDAFFDVEEREEVPMRHEGLVRKDLMGCASLHPSYRSAPIIRVFSWFQGVPMGHEMLLRKESLSREDAKKSQLDMNCCYEKLLMGCASLHPSYDFSWFQGVPKGTRITLAKVIL